MGPPGSKWVFGIRVNFVGKLSPARLACQPSPASLAPPWQIGGRRERKISAAGEGRNFGESCDPHPALGAPLSHGGEGPLQFDTPQKSCDITRDSNENRNPLGA